MSRHRLLSALLLTACFSAPPTPAQSAFQQGVVHFEAGDHAAAIRSLQAAIEAGPEDLGATETALGNVYAAAGELESALEHHNRAVAADPANHAAWVNLGVTHRRLGDYVAADAAYDKAAALAPDYPQLYASRGALYIVTGRPIEAEAALRRAIALEPELAVAHANLAVALADQGRDVAAELALEQAVEHGYDNPQFIRGRIKEAR